MKTAFAVLSLLLVSAPALAHEREGRVERRVERVRGELARERGFERYRIARFERERLEHLRGCDR